MADCDVIQAEAMTCQSTHELIPQDMFIFYGFQRMTERDMLQSLKSSLATRQKEVTTKSRARSAEHPLTP